VNHQVETPTARRKSALSSLAQLPSLHSPRQATPIAKTSDRATKAVDESPSESALVKLIYHVLNKLEKGMEEAEAKTPVGDTQSGRTAVIQSTYRLLEAVEERSGGRAPSIDSGSMKQMLMTVLTELNNHLMSLAPPQLQEARIDCDASTASVCDRRFAASGHIVEDPWDGEAFLATEELFEWFADSIDSSQPIPAVHCEDDCVDIKSVPSDSLLGACFEQVNKQRHVGDDWRLASSNMSLGSLSTKSSLGGANLGKVPSSSSSSSPFCVDKDSVYAGASQRPSSQFCERFSVESLPCAVSMPPSTTRLPRRSERISVQTLASCHSIVGSGSTGHDQSFSQQAQVENDDDWEDEFLRLQELG